MSGLIRVENTLRINSVSSGSVFFITLTLGLTVVGKTVWQGDHGHTWQDGACRPEGSEHRKNRTDSKTLMSEIGPVLRLGQRAVVATGLCESPTAKDGVNYRCLAVDANVFALFNDRTLEIIC